MRRQTATARGRGLSAGAQPPAPINLAAEPAAARWRPGRRQPGRGRRRGRPDQRWQAEMVVGAPTATRSGQTSAGAAYGLAWRADLPPTLDLAAVTPALLLEGVTSYDKLGAAVGAADLNADARATFSPVSPTVTPPAGRSQVCSGCRGWARRPRAGQARPHRLRRSRRRSHRRRPGRHGCDRRWPH